MTDQVTTDTRRRWLALIVLCLGDLMIVLDTTIVNVALPSIRTNLGFSQTSLAWVVNAYLLTFGGFLLLGGRLGDLYGHRRMFLAGVSLFTLASIACGLSTTKGLLIGARAVQGVGGAVVSAVALSLIMGLFSEPGERAKAMGVFGFVMAGGGSIGVLLGGILTDALNWHWIFLVNVPIGIAVYFLALRIVPAEHGPAASGRLDVAGAVTVTASLMLAVYAIVNGNQVGWTSAQTIGLLGAAAVLLGAFLLIEARVESPLMPLRLFRLRNVATANVVGVLWAAAMFAWFFLSALYLQQVLGYSPLEVGLAFLPANIIMGGFSLGLSAKIVMRFGFRIPLALGLVIAAVGPRAVRARTGRRKLRGRRAAEHDPARRRSGAGVQPRPARGDERRRSGGIRARIRRRQHGVHDGRSRRACGAGESGCFANRLAVGVRSRPARRPRRRVPRGVHGRGAVRARRCGCRRHVPAHAYGGGRPRARPRRQRGLEHQTFAAPLGATERFETAAILLRRTRPEVRAERDRESAFECSLLAERCATPPSRRRASRRRMPARACRQGR